MKKVFLIFLAIVALCTIVISALNLHILNETSEYISTYSNLQEAKYDAILVLGAGLRADGTPSDMLKDRLLVAIALYNSGASNKLILSGDRSGDDYDEVRSMKVFCLDQKVSEEDIIP